MMYVNTQYTQIHMAYIYAPTKRGSTNAARLSVSYPYHVYWHLQYDRMIGEPKLNISEPCPHPTPNALRKHIEWVNIMLLSPP